MQDINFLLLNSVKQFVFTLLLPAKTLSRFATDNIRVFILHREHPDKVFSGGH